MAGGSSRQERLAIALDGTMATRAKDGTLSLAPKCAEAVRALVTKSVSTTPFVLGFGFWGWGVGVPN